MSDTLGLVGDGVPGVIKGRVSEVSNNMQGSVVDAPAGLAIETVATAAVLTVYAAEH